MSEEFLTHGKIQLAVIFDVVEIKVHCGDEYEAQTLFDELVARLNLGQSVTIGLAKPPSPQAHTASP